MRRLSIHASARALSLSPTLPSPLPPFPPPSLLPPPATALAAPRPADAPGELDGLGAPGVDRPGDLDPAALGALPQRRLGRLVDPHEWQGWSPRSEGMRGTVKPEAGWHGQERDRSCVGILYIHIYIYIYVFGGGTGLL